MRKRKDGVLGIVACGDGPALLAATIRVTYLLSYEKKERTMLSTQQIYLAAAALLGGLLSIRIGEYLVHRRQQQFLNSMGGEETGAHWLSIYYSAEGVALGIMCFELLVLPKLHLPLWQRMIGLIFLIGGAALRSWSRHCLGRTWSLRLIYVLSIPIVTSGPYRYFRHPEYFSRYLELLGFSVFFGAYYGFGIYLAATLMILPKITQLERQQLRALAGAAED